MNTLIQLAILFKATTGIEGRKKLQKMVHILQAFGVPFGVRFGYHHYGPFSEDLQDKIQTLQYDKLIKEEPVVGPLRTSVFRPEGRLLRLLAMVGIESLPAWCPFAVELNQKTPRELESISTLLYIESIYGHAATPEVMENEFKILKPHLVARLAPAQRTLAEYRRIYTCESLGLVAAR
jgi:uncharacterized protein YwgA